MRSDLVEIEPTARTSHRPKAKSGLRVRDGSGLVAGRPWAGTAADLLKALNTRRETAPAPREWPETAKAMGSALRRLAPNLRGVGIAVDLPTKERGRRKQRGIRLEPAGTQRSRRSEPPEPRANGSVHHSEVASAARAECEVMRRDATRSEVAAHADHPDRSAPVHSEGILNPADDGEEVAEWSA